MRLYNSVYEYGEAEYIVQKSRFIAHVAPVSSVDAARDYVAMIKEEYRSATHNVPAFVVGRGQEMQWASDDGEPSGTSGLPVLKLVASEGLTNVVVVVTRYFGGIKLGTGGLARAYQAAARLGIEAAGICEVYESTVLTYEFDYSYYAKLQSLASEGRFVIEEPKFGTNVAMGLRCLLEDAGHVKELIGNLTAGSASLVSEKNDEIRVKIVH